MFSNFGLYHGLFECYAVNLTPIEILWRVLTFLSYQASAWLGLDWNFFLDFFSWWFQHQFSSIVFAVLLSLLGILHTLSALRWCFSWFLWLERWRFSAYSFSWLGLLLGLSTERKNVRGKKTKDYPHSLYTIGSSFIVPLFRRMGSSLRVLCAHAAAEVLLSGLSLGHFGIRKRKKISWLLSPHLRGISPSSPLARKLDFLKSFSHCACYSYPDSACLWVIQEVMGGDKTRKYTATALVILHSSLTLLPNSSALIKSFRVVACFNFISFYFP